jgi:hypothetical protein
MALLARATACCVLLVGALVSAQAPTREYQVKAVFLFNFAQFVEWPPRAFADSDTPLVIGILGEDPFGSYLDETIKGERVNNRPLEVQRYRRVEDITTCHILFVSRSESGRLDQTLANLKDRNILTVGDTDDFVRRGGTIQLANAQNRVRLLINPNAAKAASLTISSKLLRAAELVTPSR